MREELEKNLIQKYPEFFQGHKLPPTESLMCFGCECEDGWYKIIDDLCGYIKELINSDHTMGVKNEFYKKDKEHWEDNIVYLPAPEVIFTQIKEKYATLRVYFYIRAMHQDFPGREKLDLDKAEAYYWQLDQRIQSAVDFAEYISGKTCEVTGAPGNLHSRGGWFKTLCPEKAQELSYVPVIEED